MNTDQFKRAQEIVNRVTQLSRKKKGLEAIRDKKVKSLYIDGQSNGSDAEFKLNHYTNGDPDSMQQQPSSIPVLLDAFIQTSIAVYQREIDELEKEFNSL